MNADGSGNHALAGSGGFDANPDFSPDGGQIVFTAGDVNQGGTDIWVMNSDGTGATQLTTSGGSQGLLNDFAVFSPDGEKIAFTSETSFGGTGDLVVMDADGENQTTIATDAQAGASWGPVPLPAECGGRDATITGTPQDDELTGTKGRDVIATLGGDDRVDGLTGDDLLCGGGGDDKLTGRAGDDLLRGGRGDDVLRGQPGRDTCRPGRGEDQTSSCER
jgi:Ca2+-binding RTX toxin-like protein